MQDYNLELTLREKVDLYVNTAGHAFIPGYSTLRFFKTAFDEDGMIREDENPYVTIVSVLGIPWDVLKATAWAGAVGLLYEPLSDGIVRIVESLAK